jgi:DNA-binding HxlR family transcriptional regulator
MTDTDGTDAVARLLLGAKWKPRILAALAQNGRLGFGDLQRDLGGISNKVLSNDLEDLLEYDVVIRDVVQEQPVRVEYELTAAGSDLYDIVRRMTDWDAQYVTGAGRPTLLIAEDDVRQIELYSLWLSTTYDVVTVTDGRKTLDALDESIDAAVLDRKLPALHGDEVADAVREAGEYVPVALLSSEQVRPTDVSLSADLLLSKPIGRTALENAVVELLRFESLSPVARNVRGRRHRLAFVREQLGSAIEETGVFAAAVEELKCLEAGRDIALREREPWRRLVDGNVDATAGNLDAED